MQTKVKLVAELSREGRELCGMDLYYAGIVTLVITTTSANDEKPLRKSYIWHDILEPC